MEALFCFSCLIHLIQHVNYFYMAIVLLLVLSLEEAQANEIH